jgi:hypothetical protein
VQWRIRAAARFTPGGVWLSFDYHTVVDRGQLSEKAAPIPICVKITPRAARFFGGYTLIRLAV